MIQTSISLTMTRFVPLLGLISMSLLLSGCGLFGSAKATVIKEAVEALSQSKDELRQLNPEIQSVEIGADESGNGVVVEYTYKKEVVVSKEFNSESLKTKLIAQFKDNEGVKTILGYDIFVRFVFKKHDETIIADTKLEKADL